MSRLRKHADGMMRGDAHAAYQFAVETDREIDDIRTRIGAAGPAFVDDPNLAVPVVPPPPALFAVTGVDGKFLIAVTNPQDILPQSVAIMQAQVQDGNASLTPLFHQLQSATDTNFNNASNVTDYGISQQLSYEVQDPNATKFWRLRSSFDGASWNDWQLYSSAQTCGPIGVSSGQLRAEAIVFNAQPNVSNFATVDSLDAGGSATVRVYGAVGGPGTSWQRLVGATMVGPDGTSNTFFPSGNLFGEAFNTDYDVFYDTAVGIYRAFTSGQFQQSLPNGYVFAGHVKTTPSGGGTTALGTPIYSGVSPNEVITGVNVTNGGVGYAVPPDVQFNGDATGAGAAATAVLDGAGHVVGVVMTNQGAGYTGNGAVAFVGAHSGSAGGGGTAADDGGNRYLEVA